MNICVCGYYGMGNFGDELFLQALSEQFPEDEVFPYSPLVDTAKVDAVIIGGGDLITPYHYNDYYFPPELQGFLTWVYGVGIVDYYPEETWPREAVEQYRQRLQKAQGLYLRDEWSAEIARKYDFHPTVEVVPDIAFSCKQPQYPFRFSAVRQVIGVCVFAYEEFPMDTIVQLLVDLTRRDFHIALIPVVHHADNPFSDTEICKRVKERVLADNLAAEVTVANSMVDLRQTYRYIQSVDYLISFKLHPSLVALRGGVPVLCLSGMGKVRSLFKSLDLERNTMAYTEPCERIAQRMENLLTDGKRDVAAIAPIIRMKEKIGTAQFQVLRKQMRSTAGNLRFP